MILWRVQHKKTGHGPYRHWMAEEAPELIHEMIQHHNRDPKCHPSPYNDGITEYADNMRCAFVSEADLREWFKGHLRDLANHGFVMAIVSVPYDNIRFGRIQAAYRDEVATVLHTVPLTKEAS